MTLKSETVHCETVQAAACKNLQPKRDTVTINSSCTILFSLFESLKFKHSNSKSISPIFIHNSIVLTIHVNLGIFFSWNCNCFVILSFSNFSSISFGQVFSSKFSEWRLRIELKLCFETHCSSFLLSFNFGSSCFAICFTFFAFFFFDTSLDGNRFASSFLIWISRVRRHTLLIELSNACPRETVIGWIIELIKLNSVVLDVEVPLVLSMLPT